jgi:hypothetical protein
MVVAYCGAKSCKLQVKPPNPATLAAHCWGSKNAGMGAEQSGELKNSAGVYGWLKDGVGEGSWTSVTAQKGGGCWDSVVDEDTVGLGVDGTTFQDSTGAG